LLRPLPFPDSHQLVRIVEKNPTAGESSKTYTADATQDFQQQNHSFQSVSGYFAFTGPDNFKLMGYDQPVPVTGMLVAEGFFQTLGVKPALGRSFKSEEFVKHAQPVALLSYPFWKRQFKGDSSVVGRPIDLSNTSVTVIGGCRTHSILARCSLRVPGLISSCLTSWTIFAMTEMISRWLAG
jgi:hypothetical protein